MIDFNKKATLTTQELRNNAEKLHQSLTRFWKEKTPPALPVSGHWANGFSQTTFSTEKQLEYFEKGALHCPTWPIPQQNNNWQETQWAKAREYKLPLVFRVNQPEARLSIDERYITNAVHSDPRPVERYKEDGTPVFRKKMLTPYNTTNENLNNWKRCGENYIQDNVEAWKRLAQIYPNPPSIVIINNNEARRIRPKHSNYDARVNETGLSRESINTDMAYGYAKLYDELYLALSAELEELFPSSTIRVIFYNATGPTFAGRMTVWNREGPNIPTKKLPDFQPETMAIDGGSAEFYTNDWGGSAYWRDDKVFSPQIEAMNSIAQRDFIIDQKYSYIFTESTWDGNWTDDPTGPYASKALKENRDDYEKEGQVWSAERYAGWSFYLTMLYRATVGFEFRGSATRFADFKEEFEARQQNYIKIHNNKILAEAFLKGELVTNTKRKHPYNSNTDGYDYTEARDFYILENSSLPTGKLKLTSDITVFISALAVPRRDGKTSFLIFGFAPTNKPGNLLELNWMTLNHKGTSISIENLPFNGPNPTLYCSMPDGMVKPLDETSPTEFLGSYEEKDCEAYPGELEELRKAVIALNLRITELETALKDLDESYGELDEIITRLNQENNNLSSENTELTEELGQLKETVETLRADNNYLINDRANLIEKIQAFNRSMTWMAALGEGEK